MACSSPFTEAHHTTTGGMGLKGDDMRAIPLCHQHHLSIHNSKGTAGTWTEEQLNEIIETLQTKYKGELKHVRNK